MPKIFMLSGSGFRLTYVFFNVFSFLKDLFTFFLERRDGGEKERERSINVWEIHWLVASHMPPNGALARNPGMCSDWESNQQPFGSQASIQSTDPHQPGLYFQWIIIQCYDFDCHFIVPIEILYTKGILWTI